MDRRMFLKNAAVVSAVAGIAGTAVAAERYFPTKVDQTLFEAINRAKDPLQKTPLEKSHAPVLMVPPMAGAVKGRDVFANTWGGVGLVNVNTGLPCG